MENGSAPQSSAPQSTPSAPVAGGAQQASSQKAPPSSPSQGASPPPPSQSPSSPEMYEVKVNGKIQKMTRQEVIDHASMSHAANARFEEASKIKKQVDKIVATAKSNPIEALMDPALGLTKDQVRDAFEKWYTTEYIEPETLSPDQRKLRDSEAQLKKYREMEAQEQKKRQDQEHETLTNQQRDYLAGQIVEALEKSGLPRDKFLASRMAFYMKQNFNKGWEAPLDLIVQQVKKEGQSIVQSMTHNATGEQIIGILGEDVVNKIRQFDLKRLREKRSGVGGGSVNPLTSSAPHKKGEKIYTAEVNRRLRDMRMGKF